MIFFLLETSPFISLILPYLVAMGNLFLIFLFLPITKWILDYFTPFEDDAELTEKDNVAFGLTRAGEYVSVILIIAGSLYGTSFHEAKDSPILYSILQEYFENFLWAGIGLIFLLLTKYYFLERILFPYFSITKEVVNDQNAGAGAVEAAGLISIGMIIACAISGENLTNPQWTLQLFQIDFSKFLNHPFVLDLFSAFLFWICGCLMLWLFSRCYEKTLGYSLHQEMEKDNISAGVSYAFNLLAISLIVSKSIAGDFVSFTISIEKFFFHSVLGFLILLFFRFLIDRILLPNRSIAEEIIEDQNLSVSFLEGFICLGIGLVLFLSL
ncbi:MAG: DUF350 domain-containing protein [Planctomycetota bacterium]|mgnify:CR=1 FL=1